MANRLVSVVVVTYNSVRYVLDTLDSIYNQSWKEIELIITDDCSTDHTVNVCNNWIDTYKQRFVSTRIITSDKNTGVSANVNRGLSLSSGEWICFPAGDDTLKPNCIEDNMNCIEDNTEIKVLFSRVDVYNESFEEGRFITTIPKDPFIANSIMAEGRNAESQYRMLLVSDRIHYTPSLFINRKTLLSVDGFDERFELIEDYPLWLKLTKNGHRLYFLNKVTVNYREHSEAIINNGDNTLINLNYFKFEKIREAYTYPFLPIEYKMKFRYNWYVSQIFRCKFLNKNNKSARLLHELLTVFLNPFHYIIWFRNKIGVKPRYLEYNI